MSAVLWVVDIQHDFMMHDGKLNVPDAEMIIPHIRLVIDHARKTGLPVIFTADWHDTDSKELSEKPDFITTFPEHCMAGSDGAKIIDDLAGNSKIMTWSTRYTDQELLSLRGQEVTIQKDAFDVFTGNLNTHRFIDLVNPDHVFVIGVAGNVCVNQAVHGFTEKKIPVTVFSDCIKDLPLIPSCIDAWKNKGVRVTEFNPTYF